LFAPVNQDNSIRLITHLLDIVEENLSTARMAKVSFTLQDERSTVYKEKRAVPRLLEAIGCTTTAAIKSPTVKPTATLTSCSATRSLVQANLWTYYKMHTLKAARIRGLATLAYCQYLGCKRKKSELPGWTGSQRREDPR
jgi:hypothetical protein